MLVTWNAIWQIRKKNTIRNHEYTLRRFSEQLAQRELGSIIPDEVLLFLTQITEGSKHATKRVRYSLLKAFFNFIANTVDSNLINPCNAPILRKIFKSPKPVQWSILEKDAVDEIIFRQVHVRDRIILELMARGGMRVSEVLKLRPTDIDDRKLTLIDPKSGKEVEAVYIPQKLADHLKEYIRIEKVSLADRVFPLLNCELA